MKVRFQINWNTHFCAVILLAILAGSCTGQESNVKQIDQSANAKANESKLAKYDPYFVDSKTIKSLHGPKSIVRNIIQDKKGDIWLASWEGIIRYEPAKESSNSFSLPTGKAGFTNFTNKEGLRRFHVFSILEDSKGNIWFGTIGGGIYHYNPLAVQQGKEAFTNITTENGLVYDGIGCIYEDRSGKIWIGTQAGISCYDPSQSPNTSISDLTPVNFRNFTTENGMPNDDVNSIIEDKNGRLWIGTRGPACYYEDKTFIRFTNEKGRGFSNVRSMIEDKFGNIWLGGNDGLWRYNQTVSDNPFTNFNTSFTGYIYEDRSSNIWTSSESKVGAGTWMLSRYSNASLPYEKGTAVEILSEENMFFGILEDDKQGIWLGTLEGVIRFDTSLDIKDDRAFNAFRGQEK